MDHLLETCEADGPPTWGQAVAAVPADVGHGRLPPSPEGVAEAIALASLDTTWDRLRLAACAGVFRAPDLSEAEAEWMDDVLFGRWILDALPRPDHVLSSLERAGAGAVAELVRSALRSLELPPEWFAGCA